MKNSEKQNRQWSKEVSLLLVLSIFIILTSCEKFSSEPAALWTNREEFTAYAELFNTLQSEYKVSVVYRENPARAIRRAGTAVPDIVIGSFLNDKKTLPLFQPLDKLFEQEKLSRSDFYTGILKLGLFEEKQTVLPVSFSLPVLMFPDGYSGIESFALSLENIRQLAVDFTKKESSRTVMAYSPRWNMAAAFTHLELFNTDFHETQTGTLIWNNEALDVGISHMREWITAVNGGWETDTEFIEKFMYDPPYKLVRSGRILFAYSQIDDYFSIPSAIREGLDFRWLSHEDKIPVQEDILFAGIPRSAKRLQAARAFITWLLDPKTQSTLLNDSQYKRMRHFGLAGGFSSLQTVNEVELPKHFPELVGHIPPSEYLSYPQALPDIWNDLKKDGILPWIQSQLTSEPQNRSLKESIERWMNQQPQR